MSVPEIIVVYLLANSFISKKTEFKDILSASFVYGIMCYLIKNTLGDGLYTVLIIILFATIYYYLSKVSLISSLILGALSYGIKFVSEFIIIALASINGIEIVDILDNQVSKIIFSSMTLLLPIIVIYINSKKNTMLLNLTNKKSFRLDRNKFIRYVLIIMGAINIFTIGGLVVSRQLNYNNVYSNIEIVLIAIMIATIVSLIIVVLSLEKRKDIVQIEKTLMSNNLKQMEETVDLLRIQKHDIMNHLQIILMQISNGKSEDARRYILGLAEDVKNIGIVFNTGNNYIDAILNFKNRRCIDSQIELTACIDSLLENTKLDNTQLSSIFLNIIDNAIDELKKCQKEYKYIHVDTYCEDNKHVISIKNNGAKIDDTERIFEMGVSSKGINRGYGLYSIKQLLLKNKSNIYVISDCDETEFIIEIPMQKKELEAVANL